MFNVLQEYANLPAAELRDIRRQKGMYKQTGAASDAGDFLKARDMLIDLDYIHRVPIFDRNKLQVDDLRGGGERKSPF